MVGIVTTYVMPIMHSYASVRTTQARGATTVWAYSRSIVGWKRMERVVRNAEGVPVGEIEAGVVGPHRKFFSFVKGRQLHWSKT